MVIELGKFVPGIEAFSPHVVGAGAGAVAGGGTGVAGTGVGVDVEVDVGVGIPALTLHVISNMAMLVSVRLIGPHAPVPALYGNVVVPFFTASTT